MKVAVVHDIFVHFGGGERVLLAILDIYPHADVYIPFLLRPRVKEVRKHTSGKIFSPWFSAVAGFRWIRLMIKPFIFLYWKSLDLRGYDLVISSSHSFSSHAVSVGPRAVHISYIHTPPRYLYEEFNESQFIRKPVFRFMLSPIMKILKKRDVAGAQPPNILIANSKTVQGRIKKYYGRDATVIYPPVAIPKKLIRAKPLYYLCVSRLVRQKGIDLAVRACNKTGDKLVVVGEGPEDGNLRRIAGPTVSLFGFVPDQRMAAIYAGAKALLYPSLQEDFGMVPVEAMAHGIPVIGYRSGGTTETVIDGKTGILFDHWTTGSLISAMKTCERRTFRPEFLYQRAGMFSRAKFDMALRRVIAANVRPTKRPLNRYKNENTP